MAKKYYWLKLQKDFFKKHHIKIIENMTNGTDYILFYMKLLVESISHEGRLRFSDRVPYNEDMLATITGTNIDIVRSAVKIFTELELMTMEDDGTIFMAETYKMMGVETEWAEKKRLYRDTQKGQKKTLSDKSKSLELEKELDIESKSNIKKSSRFTPDLSFIENDDWQILYKEWVDNKKSPFKKQIGVEKGFTELWNISGGDLPTARQIVDKSLAGNWSGLFELKNNNKPVAVETTEEELDELWK